MSKELADILYPNIDGSILDYESIYPERNGLPEGAWITRFAPSPTGFVHIGSLLVSLINSRLAKQSGGVYFLRIEDTDKAREVEGGVQEIVRVMGNFGISFDEGPSLELLEGSFHAYGPYIQSLRLDIYSVFAKHLVEIGGAYPCFCSNEELNKTRQEQEDQKIRPGYYGKWAKCRDINVDIIKQKISSGEKFVLRLRSKGEVKNKIRYQDLVKGNLTVGENDLDAVLIKSDGFPTYHFAHVIDDHLMRTNLVLRGDEWLPSVPLHLELFDVFGFMPPKYAHIPPIMKVDNGSQRKLSKRKDPEANLEYYYEAGYPVDGVIDYLLNLANSSFDGWRRQNPQSKNQDFQLQISKIGKSGALFDLGKLDSVCKDRIGEMSGEQVYNEVIKWSSQYNLPFYRVLIKDPNYSRCVFGIEKGNEKARKDLIKWSDAQRVYGYFWDDFFEQESYEMVDFKFNANECQEIKKEFVRLLSINDSRTNWFDKFKSMVMEFNCAPDLKSYKESPERYRGHIGDIAMIIRVALTKRKNTPDLFEMIEVMGIERVKSRLLG